MEEFFVWERDENGEWTLHAQREITDFEIRGGKGNRIIQTGFDSTLNHSEVISHLENLDIITVEEAEEEFIEIDGYEVPAKFKTNSRYNLDSVNDESLRNHLILHEYFESRYANRENYNLNKYNKL